MMKKTIKMPKTIAAAMLIALATLMQSVSGQVPAKDAVRPFKVHIAQKQLTDLKRRILATQWPEKETVNDQRQGPQLATMQRLARYWATGYNWRKMEQKLNRLPQFVTNIDGLDIHFIYVR